MRSVTLKSGKKLAAGLTAAVCLFAFCGAGLTGLSGTAGKRFGEVTAAAEETTAERHVIDMTTTVTTVSDGVEYMGVGAYYAAEVVAGTDFYSESGTVVSEEEETDNGIVPAMRVTNENAWFTYRIIVPGDTTSLYLSMIMVESAANGVTFTNVSDNSSWSSALASYAGKLSEFDLASNNNIKRVILGAQNADGNYEFEIRISGGASMANRFVLMSDGRVLPASDGNYTYAPLSKQSQDWFLSTYLVKTADLSPAQYASKIYNSDGTEYGAGQISETGNSYFMYTTFSKNTMTPIGGDDVYGNNVGWFRFADGGQTGKMSAVKADGTAIGGTLHVNALDSSMTDSDVLIYRLKYADLIGAENDGDYELSKLTLRLKLWQRFRVQLFVGDEDFECAKDSEGNDLYINGLTADRARTTSSDWADICTYYLPNQGDYIDVDISRYFVGTDYPCEYIYLKISDPLDQDGNGASIEGLYLTGYYSYVGGFEISSADGEATAGSSFRLNAGVSVSKGYSVNLETVLDEYSYTIKDAAGNVVTTQTDSHVYVFDAAGAYTVEVDYTDKNGNKASTSYAVAVAAAPVSPGTSSDSGGGSESDGGGASGSESGKSEESGNGGCGSVFGFGAAGLSVLLSGMLLVKRRRD